MRVEVYGLSFRGPLHLGGHVLSLDTSLPFIPSDTLYSALFASWVRLGGDPKPWEEAFPRRLGNEVIPADPPFLLTSAFPRFQNTLFFPKPRVARRDQATAKDWKKTRFVDKGIFQKLAKGCPSDKLQFNPILLQQWLLLTEDPKIPAIAGQEEEIPRVTLDRETQASNLFSISCVRFGKGWGLWFAVAWRDPERPCAGRTFREAFDLALRELANQGIGGDRTVGYGSFSYTLLGTEEWPDPLPGRPALLLSRYHPRPDELPWVIRDSPGYEVEEIGGWSITAEGHFRRRHVRMLAPGSILIPKDASVLGDLVDVAPLDLQGRRLTSHPVWRYGLAFLFPFAGGDGRC
ncbi:MAG: type III-A CRISPR-associated RAMP protein Csm4 [Clostridia bacterium]|nr:type III-A CRISPR-associated RAMP protein Csm4 [Clostridia bacterium]